MEEVLAENPVMIPTPLVDLIDSYGL